MKKYLSLFVLVMSIMSAISAYGQNVGINNKNPTEKLSINGNLLVTQPVSESVGLPDAAHTTSLIAGRTDTFLVITDSVYRVYDPGGTGNYSANTTSATLLADTTGSAAGEVAGGFEITFDSISLGTGDTIYIFNQATNDILLRAGSNFNGTHPSFSGNLLYIYLISDTDASVGPGFSAIVRKLYVNKNAAGAGGIAGAGGPSLFFNSIKGSFKAGIGNGNNLGNGAFAIGYNCTAFGAHSGAIGDHSQASNASDMAIAGGQASGGNSLAIGPGAYAIGNSSIALGSGSRADGQSSAALTGSSYAIGNYSTALGYNARSYGNQSVAIGSSYTGSNGYIAVSMGSGANANKDYAIAIGKDAEATGTASVAIGTGSTASAENAVAFGYHAHAYSTGAVALGSSYSGGSNSTSMGSSSAYGYLSTAIGSSSNANGQSSIAAGSSSYTGADNCVAIGTSASASAAKAIAIGNYVTADGTNSTAMGNYCSTSGFNGSFTIGDNSTTTVMQTHEDNAFRARFAKGFRFYTTSAVTIGAFLNQGANSWAALSDVRKKEKFLPVNGEAFLKSIGDMKLTSWNYIGQDTKTFRHYGPMAQDFFAAFGKDRLGVIGCDTLINQQDFLGVSLIAIQALVKRTNELKDDNKQLQLKNDELTQQLADIKQQNQSFAQRLEHLEAMSKERKE